MGNVWDAMEKHEQEQPKKEGLPPKAESLKKEDSPGKAAAEVDITSSAPVLEKDSIACAGSNRYSPLLVVHHDRGSIFAEQYRSLRTNMLSHSKQDCLCVALTSAEAGEGKTITCLNLAMVLLELPGIRVIAIDGDMRKGTLSSLMNIGKSRGLADLLKGDCSLEEAIQPTSYPNLDVMPSGVIKRGEVGAILGKFEKSGIISKLRRQYDCVLVDTPAVGMISDACVLSRVLDEVLLIVRMHKTNIGSVERTVGLLTTADIKISGMFLTHQKDYVPTYFNRYY